MGKRKRRAPNTRLRRMGRFDILGTMKKIKIDIMPDGHPEATVFVDPEKHDSPMTVTLDLDALHDTVARMNDPACNPDAVVETVKRKIDAGELDRIYTAKVNEYMAIATAETNGDVLGFIEMEFLALRQIMDDETHDFRPDLHEDLIAAALSFKEYIALPIETGPATRAKKRRPQLKLMLATPLLRKRNDAINAIQVAILAAASRAKRIGSDSYRLWRDALEVVAMKDFEEDGSMRSNDIKRLIEKLKAANMMLFLDAAIADYVPLNATDDKEKEDGNVF